MKKLLIIPLTFLVTSFFLTSCGNTNTDAHMKAPVQNNADTTAKKATKESDEHEKKEKEEKKKKKISFFKPVKRFDDATTKAIYKTQADLWF
jgi:hypothetical protein